MPRYAFALSGSFIFDQSIVPFAVRSSMARCILPSWSADRPWPATFTSTPFLAISPAAVLVSFAGLPFRAGLNSLKTDVQRSAVSISTVALRPGSLLAHFLSLST